MKKKLMKMLAIAAVLAIAAFTAIVFLGNKFEISDEVVAAWVAGLSSIVTALISIIPEMMKKDEKPELNTHIEQTQEGSPGSNQNVTITHR
ncbi:MAG: hypothetical protein J6B17_00125 [Ruminococcus sp.]|nr:hypothetical protein [Ruminococcus sp.]